MKPLLKADAVKPSTANFLLAFGLFAVGVVMALGGIYVGEIDDAPGAALLGILVMIVTVALGVRTLRRKV